MSGEQNVRILIVDDDPSIVKLLGRFARDLSFEAVEAVHPREALRMASEQEIHIAVLDLHMPEMGGWELMQSLLQFNDEMKVILVTGDYSAESAARAIKHGAYDCLWKPIALDHLGEVLLAAREQFLHRVDK